MLNTALRDPAPAQVQDTRRDGYFNGGLGNMRDRIEAVGGRLTIDSSPGHGTRIRGTVPLP